MAESNASKGFTDDERAAMRERAQEAKSAARRGSRATKADGESDVLAKIAEMPDHDRAIAERLHAIVKAAAPGLSPRTWYGMPAYAREDGKVVCFFQSVTSSRPGTRRSASATRRTSTRAPCGRTLTR